MRANVSIRLVNSMYVWTIGSPLVRAATRLLVVQAGQSGQPRPDALSRTAAPVMMIPALATTPASATRRIDAGVGKMNGAAQAQDRDLRRAAPPGAAAPAGRATRGRATRGRGGRG